MANEAYKGVQAMNATSYEKGLEKGLAMNATSYEKGLEKGLEKGIENGQRQLLHDQLEANFGPLSPTVSERLEQLPADQIRALGKALLKARSLRELGLED
ncbi:MAG TPA: DUF4351 domain-containing protein [Gemmataceae bacterium]|nr:DUF4351 domain-containing protein [Gemmataceae bacterium]